MIDVVPGARHERALRADPLCRPLLRQREQYLVLLALVQFRVAAVLHQGFAQHFVLVIAAQLVQIVLEVQLDVVLVYVVRAVDVDTVARPELQVQFLAWFLLQNYVGLFEHHEIRCAAVWIVEHD